MKWAMVLLGVALCFGLSRRPMTPPRHVALFLIVVAVIAVEAVSLHAT